MPQPLFYVGPEDVLEQYSVEDSVDDSMDDLADDSTDADVQTEVSSESEIEEEPQAEYMTEAIRSSVTDMMSTCGYLYPQFRVPPPSPASSSTTSSNGALTPSGEISSEPTPSFLRFYDYHDLNNDNYFPGLLADRETVIIGFLFHNAIEGLYGPLNLKDLAMVLKFRNKHYKHWQSLTEKMVLRGFMEMLGAHKEPNSTVKDWYSLYKRDTTGESNDYFKELKAQLLKDLQCAKHEQDEVENNCIFVKKGSYPAGPDGVKERSWIAFGRPYLSVEEHKENMPNSTFKSWYFLHNNPPTGNSRTYFREITAQLLQELDDVERERDEVQEKCFFVKEGDEEKERIWVSFDGPRFMMKNHEQNMLSVQRWIENTE
ncbi:hypothetical protein JMJ35_004700 [Cladonia borealis]|uniref:Uncharacterized protein n=1 Tax=Cladonia borealis TaxID=184061 RepID=A0AA39V1U0_9LECA|nr:hypothetical protein JMJ35_004700 [Cladonia borealis]